MKTVTFVLHWYEFLAIAVMWLFCMALSFYWGVKAAIDEMKGDDK